MDYWLTTEVEKGVESSFHAAKRLNTLLRNLVRFTKRQLCPQKVTWILITSGEVIGAWTKNLPGVNKAVGLKPGRWLRLDIPSGSFSEKADLIHHKGASRKIDLTWRKEQSLSRDYLRTG